MDTMKLITDTEKNFDTKFLTDSRTALFALVKNKTILNHKNFYFLHLPAQKITI